MIFRIGKLCGRQSRLWKPKLFERPRRSARDRLEMARRLIRVHRLKILQRRRSLEKTRFALIREAQRVAGLRKMKLAGVVDRAAKGTFTYRQITQLTVDDIPAMKAAKDVLRKVTS